MANCDLSIDLDDPDVFHQGGAVITGVVRVDVDADVNCSALEVQSGWRTHGRGNIDSHDIAKVSLFSGQWQAGDKLEYRFELPIAEWPPTYHGHYLSVDHYVDARAKIPWSFDPKATQPFLMCPGLDVEIGRAKKDNSQLHTVVRMIVGFIVFSCIALAMAGFALAGPFALFFLLFPSLGGLIWFVRKFLPRWMLGEVKAELSSETIRPGQSVRGSLNIQPKRSVPINAISLLLQAREQCVSGSGSNRKTHTHILFEQTEILQDRTTLAAGVPHQFPFSVMLPDDAPCSLELDDNKLIWSTKLRVDIPRWPDWVREIPFVVAPTTHSESGHPPEASVGESGQRNSMDFKTRGTATTNTPGAWEAVEDNQGSAADGVTFMETAEHLWNRRDQSDEVGILVDAVTGLTFDLQVIVERRLLYSGDDDPHVFKDGYAVWAHYTQPPLPLVLYVPHDLADEFEQIGRDTWKGRGTVLGWDARHGRLQLKLESGKGES